MGTASATGVVVVGTGGLALAGTPATAFGVATVANTGVSDSAEALKFLDSVFSGSDDLMININREKVLPASSEHSEISAGETIAPDIRLDFDGSARLQFVEYDSGRNNLESCYSNSAIWEGHSYYGIESALVYNDEEGSVY